MFKPSSTAASVILTFFVTLLLNTAINYYSSDKGRIGVGKSFPLNGKMVSIVSIENYSSDFMDGVAIQIPSTVALSEIVSDNPIQIVEPPATSGQTSRIVKLNQIGPRLTTHIFVPFPASVDSQVIRVANPAAVGLTLRQDDELESPLRKALLSALVIAMLYGSFSWAVGYYTGRKIKELEATVDKCIDKAKTANERIEKMELRISKQRILLLGRINDYAKELEFWRNAMRALIFNNSGTKKCANELIGLVTKTLKSYGTNGQQHDFETIRVAAAWLRDGEKEFAQAKDEERL